MGVRQLELVGTHEVMRHGGRRKGAGRKPGPGRKRHAHRARPFVHLSIQGNHIHLLCEADDRLALANGIRGFCVSAARRLNLAISKERGEQRRGRVFTDRYHATTVAHPRQARSALAYVLNNWRKHRETRDGEGELARGAGRVRGDAGERGDGNNASYDDAN